MGDIVLKVAPLIKHRNETIHQYLKVNWQNIIKVRESLPEIREFTGAARRLLMKGNEGE